MIETVSTLKILWHGRVYQPESMAGSGASGVPPEAHHHRSPYHGRRPDFPRLAASDAEFAAA